MIQLLLVVSMLLINAQNIFLKEFNKRFMRNFASYYIYMMAYMAISLVIFLAGADFRGIPPQTIAIASFQGILYIIIFLLYTKAFETGPFSFTNLIVSASLVFPVFFGIIVWGERLRAVHVIGLILLIPSIYLGTETVAEEDKKKSRKWLLLSLGTCLGYGALMISNKTQQIITPGLYIREFMAIVYAVAIVFAGILLSVELFKYKRDISHLKDKKFIALFAAHGVDSGFSSMLGLYLAGVLPASVYFPIIDGSVVVFAAVAAVVLYKEKPTVKSVAGLSIGLVSILLLCVV